MQRFDYAHVTCTGAGYPEEIRHIETAAEQYIRTGYEYDGPTIITVLPGDGEHLRSVLYFQRLRRTR